jgi:hypothetical protein
MIINYTLRHGSHESPQDGLCAMEWVAYLAGEKHSDYPSCVDLALRGFAIGSTTTCQTICANSSAHTLPG